MTTANALPILAELDDPTKYVRVPSVPVFDAHDEFDADGKLVRHFGRDELSNLAERCNQRETNTGDLSPLGPGHTIIQKPGTPLVRETDQPPVWGYARNWHLGDFGPARRQAVLVDFYVKCEHFEEFKTYPRRSVELWFKDGIIDRIALLRRTPMRDLGVIDSYLPPNVPETDLTPRWLTAPVSGQPARTYERGGIVLYYAMEDLAAGRTQEPDGDDVKMCGGCQALKKEFGALWGHLSKKYAAEVSTPTAGYPSSNNGSVPAMATTDEPRKDPTQFAKPDEQAVHYAKLERENADLKEALAKTNGRLDELSSQYQRKDRETALTKLQRDGYRLDVEEELTACQGQTADQFGKHLERIAKHYQKDPTAGGYIGVFDGPVESGGKRAMSREEMQGIASEASRSGKTFDEVLASRNGSK